MQHACQQEVFALLWAVLKTKPVTAIGVSRQEIHLPELDSFTAMPWTPKMRKAHVHSASYIQKFK